MTTTPATSPTSTKPRVRRIASHRYLVESKSQPGVGRQVDTLNLKCSCPAGKAKMRCWHLVTALHVEECRRRLMTQPGA